MPDDQAAIFAAAVLLLPLGLVVRASQRLVYGARGPSSGDTAHHLINVVAWGMISIGLICVVAMTLVFSLIIGYAVLELILARRAQARQIAWSLVGAAARRGRPLPQAAELGRERFTGGMRREFEKFADDITGGVEATAAIARRRGVFPRHAQGVAALAKGGDLSLLAVANIDDDEPNGLWGCVTGGIGYLLLLTTTGTTILSFVFIRIIPEFRKIFEEFQLSLPPITELLISVTHSFPATLFGATLMLLAGGLIKFALVLWVLYLIGFHPLRPLTDRLFFDRHRARVLRLLAAAARRGQPFEAALDNLANGSPRYRGYGVTSRLRRALRLAQNGVDWRDALRRGGLLLKQEQPLLHAAERAGNLPWAMETLADQAISRSLLRWQSVLQFLFPTVIVTLGVLVGWVCIGLFAPLVKLIEGLT